MNDRTFAIFDRKNELLENGFFTEGEALRAAEKYYPGEETYVDEICPEHPTEHQDCPECKRGLAGANAEWELYTR